jgi:hypothetical protein
MEAPLTIVSGHWFVPNKHNNRYLGWFYTSLKINAPYVFFGNKESIQIVSQYRGNLPTHYIECEIEDFYTYKYKDKMRLDRAHCPSAELNMIWNEKIFLIEKAAALNPFKSSYFAWVDAGICSYRSKMAPSTPFPDINKLVNLPKDKLIFTSSVESFEPERLSGYYHYVCGTAYVLHRDIIPRFVELYREYIDKLINLSKIYTDQVIWTHIYRDYPELFYKLGNGYGEVVPLLYG